MKSFNPEKTKNLLTEFIKNTLEKAGFSKVVVGVSGGIDSAVSTLLAVNAIGKENIYPVLLPYGSLSTQATLDAMTFLSNTGIPVTQIIRIDIKNAVDELARQSGAADSLRRGNLMARIRMACLFDQAKKRNALVLGTENRTEYELGYYTRYGDEASDLEPLRICWKTEVYEIARMLGVPENILKKAPSADLWFEQTDEKEFGFTYEEADRVLSLLLDDGKSEAEIVSSGMNPATLQKILTRREANLFKRNLPVTPQADIN
jgi:NAD+ synthase